MSVSLPYFKGCQAYNVTPDSHGVFDVNLTVLNSTIPYTIRVSAQKTGFDPINVDYFVGGYPITDKVELGSFAFVKGDN
jgi:hypothetical protein